MTQRGQCFEKSANTLMNLPIHLKLEGEWVLCHGIVTGTGGPVEGKKYGHGWLENEALVFDTVSGKVLPKELYNKVGQIEEVFRYTRKTMMDLLFDTEHYGPWEPCFFDPEKTLQETPDERNAI